MIKINMKVQRTSICPKNKMESWNPIILRLIIGTAMKAACYWPQDWQLHQQNTIQSPKINPCMHEQWILKSSSVEERIIFPKWCEDNWISMCKMKINATFKNYIKVDQNSNLKFKTIKFCNKILEKIFVILSEAMMS